MRSTNTKITPCKNICRYVEYEDTKICEGCGRTYDDLDAWGYLSTDQKRERIKIAKQNLKKLAKI